MEKTWKPTAAGVLCIVAGVADLGFGVLVFAAASLVQRALAFTDMEWLAWLLVALSPLWFVLGIVAIVGGVFALRRRVWGLAPAGAICALSGCSLFGILAIIFVALARREFD
ncbi:MAG: hypothetical protein ACLFVD_01770 [Dehalococcoidia bacterium]